FLHLLIPIKIGLKNTAQSKARSQAVLSDSPRRHSRQVRKNKRSHQTAKPIFHPNIFSFHFSPFTLYQFFTFSLQ
ncbi:MAG: hypothetical protein LBR13_04165, partial [Dysgonamonadaceae bacterium]|nr:hypothetical protein [Dysgonamonadaceae bacterium]